MSILRTSASAATAALLVLVLTPHVAAQPDVAAKLIIQTVGPKCEFELARASVRGACGGLAGATVDSLAPGIDALVMTSDERVLRTEIMLAPDTLTQVVADVAMDTLSMRHVHNDSVFLWLAREYTRPSQGRTDVLPFERAPVIVARRPPEYPKQARLAKLEGVVLLELSIDAEGVVVDGRVVQGIPGLDDAAVACAKQFRYRPAELFGRCVPTRHIEAVRFTLRG